MEAHNGLSAKIVEEAGFAGIWASGLTISASLGLRDNNEATWTQVLDVLEFMSDATKLPILVDGDTGHGNFNNVRRLVRKLDSRGIAGVCIEDKLFPKTNSFIGSNHPLADTEEFCGRLRAGKDSQLTEDFVLVARVEALISGCGLDEALRRAEAYAEAGADAIMIHSRKTDAAEILEFTRRWSGRLPVLIAPTTYYATPSSLYQQAGISTVIWANHLMRAAITAMQDAARRIHEECGLGGVEGRVAPVKEIFRLVGNAELEEAERRYLPGKVAPRAVILAASSGVLKELTQDQPKAMIDVRGRSILQRLVDTLRNSNIQQIAAVCGHRHEAVNAVGIEKVLNHRHNETSEVYSLAQAHFWLQGSLVVAYGDILVRCYVLDGLLASPFDITLAVDAEAPAFDPGAPPRDLVSADRGFVEDGLDDDLVQLRQVSADPGGRILHGEWMGVAHFTARGADWLREEIRLLEEASELDDADLPLLLTRIAAKHPVHVKYFTAPWMNINTLLDVAAARNFT